MKIGFILILSIAICTSCKVKQKTIEKNESETIDIRKQSQEHYDSYYTLYQIANNKFIGQDSLVTTHYLNGEIQSIGKFDRTREWKCFGI